MRAFSLMRNPCAQPPSVVHLTAYQDAFLVARARASLVLIQVYDANARILVAVGRSLLPNRPFTLRLGCYRSEERLMR